MHYVYILQSEKDKQLYIGCTKDLQKRVREHNSGDVRATKSRIPLKVVHYEAFTDKMDAFAREQWLKTGWGRTQIEKMLTNALKVSAVKELTHKNFEEISEGKNPTETFREI
jgi:putative endonuclease